MATIVYKWCITKGWEPDINRSFGDEIALLHSEVSEALEAFRSHGFDTVITDSVTGKRDDVASEFADIFIRLLHYSYVHDIDLEREFKVKMAYNETRAYRHGGRTL